MEISEVTVDNRNLLPDIILRKTSNILNTLKNKGKQNQKQDGKMIDEGRTAHFILISKWFSEKSKNHFARVKSSAPFARG
jgi:hypothetical protein